ncbi:MAG: DUF1659 domain-containing protein [Firmicutes bacterium]|nr:DUF1659 domain-containing protein [Bacillota bacterium]
MAISSNPLSGRLQLRLVVGMDDLGNYLYRTQSYSNLKPTASDQDVYDVGSALAGLQEHGLEEVRRVSEVVLIEEP